MSNFLRYQMTVSSKARSFCVEPKRLKMGSVLYLRNLNNISLTEMDESLTFLEMVGRV